MSAKWLLSLENGETLDEEEVRKWPTNLSPWQKAINYCKEKDLKITSMRVQVNGITHMSPAFTDKAKFKSDMQSPNFADGQPVIFRGRKEKNISSGHEQDFYQMHFQINVPTRITWYIDENDGCTWLRFSEKEAEV